ncbi:MAG: hypothetical protein DMG14_28735, partial [Acidobacteria bacterium]
VKPSVIRIAQQNRLTGPLAEALSKSLQDHFPAIFYLCLPGRSPTMPASIEEGQVEVAIIPANVAYLAYTQGWGELPHPHKKLWSRRP